jgi:hypothetical protein
LCLGVFLYFHTNILCNYQGHWEHFDIFTLSFEILNYKSYWCVRNMCWWVVSKPFRRRVLCHMVAKSSLPMSLWMCHHVLFHVVWHVAARLLSMILHFFSSYFLTPDSSSTPLSFFCSSNPVLILVISYFVLIPFIEVFLVFNLVLQLQFLICFVLLFGP